MTTSGAASDDKLLIVTDVITACMVWPSDIASEYLHRHDRSTFYHLVFTRGQFWPSGIVVACVCVSVCPCVRVSVCVCVNHGLVRTITHHSFKLESPNLEQRCKRPWLRCLLFLGMIDLDLQGQIQLESQILPHFELVRPITHQPCMLESPNLDRKCILALLRCLLILDKIGFDLHLHFQSWNRFFYQIYLRSACIIFSETRRL